MMNFNYGFELFGLLFSILWWVLLLTVAIALVQWVIRQSKTSMPDSKAIDILKERYARGEIDKEEYEERKRVLS